MNARLLCLLCLLACAACVTREIEVEPGVGSFRVTLMSIDPFARPPDCATDFGERHCPRPFADESSPVTVRLSAEALDKNGQPLAWNGVAQLDIRPGRLHGVGPGGRLVTFTAGQSGDIDVQVTRAHGAARFWLEHCGDRVQPGSFATGVSGEIWFDAPRIDQINATADNTTSSLVPRADNVCAIVGDPRYGLGTDEEGNVGFVGWSHGRAVNAPPPAIGSFVEIRGCTAAEHAAGTCAKGPLVVTAVDNEGFYVTDSHPDSQLRGFNHLFAFTFSYPEDLEVGDVLTLLRGSPVEFAGSTQLGNPLWVRDSASRGANVVPTPVTLDSTVYASTVRTYGRNDAELLTLERLENGVVCMDGLAPAAELRSCDTNHSGGIERQGCLVDFDAPLPPLCSDGKTPAPAPPACDADSMRPFCMALTAEDLEACKLSGYIPANPAEYCCERVCYDDVNCSEGSAMVGFGQWAADVNGNYEPGDAPPVKIAVISRDADPDFDPLAFGRKQRESLASGGPVQRLRIVGNLRQVLAARPVWVLVARTPADIEVDGVCP